MKKPFKKALLITDDSAWASSPEKIERQVEVFSWIMRRKVYHEKNQVNSDIAKNAASGIIIHLLEFVGVDEVSVNSPEDNPSIYGPSVQWKKFDLALKDCRRFEAIISRTSRGETVMKVDFFLEGGEAFYTDTFKGS